MKKYTLRSLFLWGGVVVCGMMQTAVTSAAETPLTLESAIAKAKANAPQYQAAKAQLEMASGALRQAKAWPNPSLDIEAENFGGSGAFKGTDEAEFTYMISQPLEIGGKRSARRKASKGNYKAVSTAYKAAEMRLEQTVATAYYRAVAAHEALLLSEQQTQFAGRVLNIVQQKVEAGRESEVQKQKAQVNYETAKLQQQQAARQSKLAKQALVNAMGVTLPDVQLVKTSFLKLDAPNPYNEYQQQIKKSPLYIEAQQKAEASRHGVAFEKAQNIPDPTLRFGVRELNGPSEHAFVAGVSFPLPVLNQNQGNIRKAYGAQLLAEQNLRQTLFDLEQTLLMNWQTWQQGAMEAQQLKDVILPAARKSAELAQESYNKGRFPFIEFLDAQRTYFQTQEQYFEALRQMHESRAAVLAMTQTNFEETPHE